jgi:hypothetical protein
MNFMLAAMTASSSARNTALSASGSLLNTEIGTISDTFAMCHTRTHHRVISLRGSIWSLSGHSGHRASGTNRDSIYGGPTDLPDGLFEEFSV